MKAALCVQNGKVVLAFPAGCFKMTPQEARIMAKKLIDVVEMIEAGTANARPPEGSANAGGKEE
jgi:hypothetical protein